MNRDPFAAKGTPPGGLLFDEREVGAILTGLRLLQHIGTHNLSSPMRGILTDDDSFEALTDDEIDTLCEKVNV